MTPAKDRDLLLGILSDEMGIVDRERLVAVMNAWAAQDTRPLDDMLLESGCLAEEQRAWLSRIVERQIQQHGGARDSLRSLGVPDAAAKLIDSGASPELTKGLSTLVPARGGLGAGDGVGPPTSLAAARYQIVGRHASGGLGEIFLARDTELHRDVALKGIQLRFVDNADIRARFVLEAEITGGLEHPNIVPVHGLGTDQDGRPFYVMRFIRGESLHDAINRFHGAETAGKPPGERTLMLRRLLGCFIDVCNAAAYAHSRGVIHRDLKPANVMLGPYGETLLLDWGLAKLVQRDPQAAVPERQGEEAPPPQSTLHPGSAESPTPTRVGSVVGTPAYMSPEQAAGLVDQLGPASDIYSLGAILYHLLTGRVPFDGENSDEIRHQIIVGRCLPPRQANPRVSPALEAVCLKAMAVDPQRRYATARELADEVESWLADEPVGAWREPWSAAAWRWMRRHRTLVAASMATVLVAAVCLMVGIVLLKQANQRERAATRRAERQEQQARDAADRERAAKELAKRQEQQARANFQMARDAVDKYLTRVSEDPRLKGYDLEGLRRDLLGTARDFYEQFTRQQSDDPELQAASAWAEQRLATITAEIGARDDAVTLLQKARDKFSKLAGDARIQSVQGTNHLYGKLKVELNLAGLLANANLREAAADLETARKLAAELLRRDPQNPRFREGMAMAHSIAATHCCLRKDFAGAADEYRAAIAIRTKLVDEGQDPAEQDLLAKDETSLGAILCRGKDRLEGQRFLMTAGGRYMRLMQEHGDVPEYMMNCANTCDIMAVCNAQAGGDRAQIEVERKQALAVRATLSQLHPKVAQYKASVAESHVNLGLYYLQTGQWAKSEEHFLAAQGIFQQLKQEHPDQPGFWDGLGLAAFNLGCTYRALDRHQEALSAFQTSHDIFHKLAIASPDNCHYLSRLGFACMSLGDTFSSREQAPQMDAAYQEALGAYEKMVAKFAPDMDEAANLGWTYIRLGRLALRQGQPQKATEWADKAEKFIASRSAAERDLFASKLTVLIARLCRAGALAQAGDHAGAAAAAKQLAPSCASPSTYGQGWQLYCLATVWALASDAAGKDVRLAPAERSRLAEQYAAAAVAALTQSRDTGFFKDPHQVRKCKEDSCLDVLRNRKDFQGLWDAPKERGAGSGEQGEGSGK